MESLLRHGAAPIVIAHRGDSATHPENTLVSFDAAWRAGADWVETDVQPTADDALVLLHDDTVDRTTDGSGTIGGLTSGEVARLDAGGWFGPAFAGTRVPRLTDLLARLTGGRRLMLEVKGRYTAAQVASVAAQIRAAGVADRVFLESFQVPVLRELHAMLPDEALGLLVERIGDDPVGACRELGAGSYNPSVADLLAHPDLVDRVHAAGISVVPWTSDDPRQWAKLTALGVDGIFTNTPGALLAWQTERSTRA